MRTTARLALPALVVALAACENSATAPQRATAAPRMAGATIFTARQIPLSGSNDCTGQPLTGTGNLHEVYNVTVDAAGGFHGILTQQYSDVRVTDASGATFVSASVTTNPIAVTSGGAEAQTYTSTFTLIGQGQTPNEVARVTGHYTFDANGVLTSYVDRVNLTCR